jgi:hypothetical protein
MLAFEHSDLLTQCHDCESKANSRAKEGSEQFKETPYKFEHGDSLHGPVVVRGHLVNRWFPQAIEFWRQTGGREGAAHWLSMVSGRLRCPSCRPAPRPELSNADRQPAPDLQDRLTLAQKASARRRILRTQIRWSERLVGDTPRLPDLALAFAVPTFPAASSVQPDSHDFGSINVSGKRQLMSKLNHFALPLLLVGGLLPEGSVWRTNTLEPGPLSSVRLAAAANAAGFVVRGVEADAPRAVHPPISLHDF